MQWRFVLKKVVCLNSHNSCRMCKNKVSNQRVHISNRYVFDVIFPDILHKFVFQHYLIELFFCLLSFFYHSSISAWSARFKASFIKADQIGPWRAKSFVANFGDGRSKVAIFSKNDITQFAGFVSFFSTDECIDNWISCWQVLIASFHHLILIIFTVCFRFP